MTQDELDLLKIMGAFHTVRELPDGTVAGLQPLITTWSVVLGVTPWGWRYRFCYENLGDARRAFDSLKAESDIPDGWMACRPEVRLGRGRDTRYPTPQELRLLRAWTD